jgi:8-amino-7-oxononanoate synthase
MNLLNQLAGQLRTLDEQSLIRKRRTVDTPCGARVTVDGRQLLAFCSNDYLGLANHPKLKLSLQEGAAIYGVGSGASHMISGHVRAHAMLEDRLAEFVGGHLESARALTFCTGYMANLAIITGLTAGDREAEIFSESLNHASLIDGARLSRAKVTVYPHADLDALAAMLAASNAATKLVVTDSVFSMDGDLAPLPALLALCERHGAWLVIDDAHGFGVLGDHGRGVLEHFNLRSPYLVYMGTLGKAAGVGGAFVAAHETVIETLIQKARPYIFTTATPPALAHALLTSIELIEGQEGIKRRAHLAALVAQLDDGQVGLKLRRWRRLPSTTAIQPILIGDNAETMRAGAALYEQGLWVGTIRPPTVAPGTSRLRVTLSAAHSSMEVAQLITALNNLDAPERTSDESR